VRVYLPVVAHRPIDPRQGVSIRFGNCQDAIALQANWVWDWGNGWCESYLGFAGGFYNENGIGKTINSPYVVGFNEPDLTTQANIEPCAGATLWRQIEMSYTLKVLVSPVPSQLHPEWLWDMVGCYSDTFDGERPRFDAIQAHYYWWPGQPTLQVYIGQLRAGMIDNGYGGNPIWLTEFGVCPFPGIDQIAWLREAVAWIRAQTDIARYAWYSARVEPTECAINLIDAAGQPNALGVAYMEAGQ
jgi:hypothetical protein